MAGAKYDPPAIVTMPVPEKGRVACPLTVERFACPASFLRNRLSNSTSFCGISLLRLKGFPSLSFQALCLLAALPLSDQCQVFSARWHRYSWPMFPKTQHLTRRKVGFRRGDGEDGMSKATTEEPLEEDGFENG